MTSAYEHGVCPQITMRHRLRIAREFAGLEQTELAELMGTTRSTVSNAETGKVEPQRTTVNAWALACGVPASWIRTGQSPGDHPDGSSGLGIIRAEERFATRSNTPRAERHSHHDPRALYG